MRSAATFLIRDSLLPIVGVVVLVLLWYAAIAAKLVDPVLLPSPWETMKAMWSGLADGTLLHDFLRTVERTILATLIAMVLAIPLGIVLGSWPRLYLALEFVIDFFRSTPASAMFPLFLPEGVTVDKLLRAQVGIILFTAAYLAEAVRGGLQAVPRGQYEAADALGLGYWKKMGLIILPQALKISIPPLVNQFISMFKDTSLVIIIGLFDLLTTAKTALSDPAWRPFFVETYTFVALIYFGFCFFMSRYSQFLERRMETGHRRT